MYYHVRGKNGGSSKEDPDDKNSDTRWVQLKELVMNMDDSQLTSLDTWAGQLQKVATAARKRVQRDQESNQ